MKQIYIILTHTGTTLSKIIKSFTKDEFSHVSISLDINLEKMYSFGRTNPYNPFWGGFVHESVNSGTFKRFKRTKALIYSLEVADKQYEIIDRLINHMKSYKKIYRFNVFGLFGVGFNKKVKIKHGFYCAEFVKYILKKADIDIELPELIRPENFKDIKNAKIIYKGLLREYGKTKVRPLEYIKNGLEVVNHKEGIV